MSWSGTPLIMLAALAVCGSRAPMADAVTVYGEAKGPGHGFAEVYAELDFDDENGPGPFPWFGERDRVASRPSGRSHQSPSRPFSRRPAGLSA